MSIENNVTGYPSIDKPWLKYYTEEEIQFKLPECTLYEHIKNKNHDNLSRIAIIIMVRILLMQIFSVK